MHRDPHRCFRRERSTKDADDLAPSTTAAPGPVGSGAHRDSTRSSTRRASKTRPSAKTSRRRVTKRSRTSISIARRRPGSSSDRNRTARGPDRRRAHHASLCTCGLCCPHEKRPPRRSVTRRKKEAEASSLGHDTHVMSCGATNGPDASPQGTCLARFTSNAGFRFGSHSGPKPCASK